MNSVILKYFIANIKNLLIFEIKPKGTHCDVCYWNNINGCSKSINFATYKLSYDGYVLWVCNHCLNMIQSPKHTKRFSYIRKIG
jgi:hypothetical protein